MKYISELAKPYYAKEWVYYGEASQVVRISDDLSLVTLSKPSFRGIGEDGDLGNWIEVTLPFFKGLKAEGYQGRIVGFSTRLRQIPLPEVLNQTIESDRMSDSAEIPCELAESIVAFYRETSSSQKR